MKGGTIMPHFRAPKAPNTGLKSTLDFVAGIALQGA